MHPAGSDAWLKSKRVAFTGRLASMTRAEGVALIRKHGGYPVSKVTRLTSLLVVGQDGWPLQKDGRLTTKLRTARSLQRVGCKLAVIGEEELLGRLDSESLIDGVRRLYGTAQLSSLLKIPGDRLRGWLTAGLIQAAQTVEGVSYFDYGQVVSARALCDLIEAGVTVDRLRRSISQMQAWLGNVERPMLQLAILERSGALLVRLEDGLSEPTGQRCFDFAGSVDPRTLSLPGTSATAEDWFELGCEHEDAGRFNEAVKAYQQALLAGRPDATVCFNLANALFALGHKERATERFYQAVELNSRFAEAWNNLGVVLSDLGRSSEAVIAFERALAENPAYTDAHFNLADLLDQTGNASAARTHWQVYLRHDLETAWAAHARRRLKSLGN
jgi:tetratricopeptide (TPR) repeat protein